MNSSLVKKYSAVLSSVYNYLNKSELCSNPPIRVWIEPTNQCNLKCMGCANRLIKEKGYMKLSLFKKIIEQLSNYSFEAFLYMSGEPLMHPEIIEMINYATKMGLFVNLSTNITLLDRELSHKILCTDLDRITFSLDTFDKIGFESNRIGASHDDVIEKIILFLKLKREHNSKVNVFIRLNKHYVKESEQARAIERRLIRLGAKINTHHTHDWCGKISLPINIQRENYFHCFHCYSGISIQWNGNVVPCCRDFFGEYVLGNVNETPIKEIWNNERTRNLRKMLADKRFKEIELCKQCDMIWGKTLLGFPLKIIKSYIKCRE